MHKYITRLNTSKEAEQLAANAQEQGNSTLAEMAIKRGQELRAQESGYFTPAEQGLAIAIYVYEDAQKQRTGRKNYRANRTWQKIQAVGGNILAAAEDMVIAPRPTIGFGVLEEDNLREHSFEAVIDRFPDEFSAEAVAAARARLRGEPSPVRRTARPVAESDTPAQPLFDSQARTFLHGFSDPRNWCRSDWLPRYRVSLERVEEAKSNDSPEDIFDLLWKTQDNAVSHAGQGTLKFDDVDRKRAEIIAITRSIFLDGTPSHYEGIVRQFEQWKEERQISMVPWLLIARAFAAIHPSLYHTTVDRSSQDEVIWWFAEHTGFADPGRGNWALRAQALTAHLDLAGVFPDDQLGRNIFPWFVLDQLRAGTAKNPRRGHRPRALSSFAHIPESQREIALRHNKLLTDLYRKLVDEYGEKNVCTEHPTGTGGYADAVVWLPGNECLLYELKIADSAALVVRQAMGQLLDYGYRGRGLQPKKLIAVGEPELDEEMRIYMGRLQAKFEMDIEYLQIKETTAEV